MATLQLEAVNVEPNKIVSAALDSNAHCSWQTTVDSGTANCERDYTLLAPAAPQPNFYVGDPAGTDDDPYVLSLFDTGGHDL
jgi:hypothetical protein